MTASSEDKQLLAIVERILRLKSDGDAISDDIKEVYAEAKSAGYDKTAIGQIVALKRREAKDPAKHAELTEIVELYMAAIERASHTHTYEAAA